MDAAQYQRIFHVMADATEAVAMNAPERVTALLQDVVDEGRDAILCGAVAAVKSILAYTPAALCDTAHVPQLAQLITPPPERDPVVWEVQKFVGCAERDDEPGCLLVVAQCQTPLLFLSALAVYAAAAISAGTPRR